MWEHLCERLQGHPPRAVLQIPRLVGGSIYNHALWTAKATIRPKPSIASRSLVIFETPKLAGAARQTAARRYRS